MASSQGCGSMFPPCNLHEHGNQHRPPFQHTCCQHCRSCSCSQSRRSKTYLGSDFGSGLRQPCNRLTSSSAEPVRCPCLQKQQLSLIQEIMGASILTHHLGLVLRLTLQGLIDPHIVMHIEGAHHPDVLLLCLALIKAKSARDGDHTWLSVMDEALILCGDS